MQSGATNTGASSTPAHPWNWLCQATGCVPLRGEGAQRLRRESPLRRDVLGVIVQGAQNLLGALVVCGFRDLVDLGEQLLHGARPAEPAPDVDQDLYGGFVGNNDRRQLNDLRGLTGAKLATARTGFDDPRLAELVWRYRARNFPETLSPEELERWDAHRAACLFDGQGGARTIEQLFSEIDALSETADDRAQDILGALYDYAEHVAPER